MEPIELLAMTFGTIAATSFFFQALKIEKLHESKEIAIPTYLILLVTAIIWLAYGFSIKSTPIIVSNTVGTISTATVILAYFHYRLKKQKKSKP